MNFALTREDEALKVEVARIAVSRFRPLAEPWGERDELNWELARALGRLGTGPGEGTAEGGSR